MPEFWRKGQVVSANKMEENLRNGLPQRADGRSPRSRHKNRRTFKLAGAEIGESLIGLA